MEDLEQRKPKNGRCICYCYALKCVFYLQRNNSAPAQMRAMQSDPPLSASQIAAFSDNVIKVRTEKKPKKNKNLPQTKCRQVGHLAFIIGLEMLQKCSLRAEKDFEDSLKPWRSRFKGDGRLRVTDGSRDSGELVSLTSTLPDGLSHHDGVNPPPPP